MQRKRVTLTLEPELGRAVADLARRRREPIARTLADLARDALDRQEDAQLSALAEKREVATKRTVPHDRAW